MSIKCDVLIVGAGIAGSTCAVVLGKLGIDDVHVIERSKGIGLSHSQKIDFAEDKGLKKSLKKYNLPIIKETNVSRWFAPNQDMFELKSKINDIWFKRGDESSYENTVLKKSSANVIVNTDVVNISNGNVTAVDQRTREKIKYRPKMIVIATGNHLPYFNRDKEDKIIQNIYAKGFVFDSLDIGPDIPHIFFDNDFSQGSYLFMVQDSEESVGYLTYGSTINTSIKVENLKRNRVIEKAISKSKIKKQICGTLYIGKQCSLAYGNMLFIGDAANLMDPFLSYGVTNSVKSGIFAAEAIANGKSAKNQYKMLVNKEIFPELKKQFKMRKFFNKLENEDINCIIGLLNDLNAEGDIEELFDNTVKLTIKLTPRLIKELKLLKIFFKGIECII